jgi:TetR/AcrR family transcriptional repressor of nem operon
MGAANDQRLTPKGRATRNRIVSVAADLMSEQGVTGTSIEDVRSVAGVSGSQMTHYFTDKGALVRAVIGWQARAALDLHLLPELGELDSFAALDLWAELHIARQKRSPGRAGCPFGALAGELAEPDDATRAELACGFARWVELFRHGLRLMRQRGELRKEADPDELATGLLSALQGGMLLSRTASDSRPLELALKTMLGRVRSFAVSRAERANTRRKPAVSRRANRLIAAL